MKLLFRVENVSLRNYDRMKIKITLSKRTFRVGWGGVFAFVVFILQLINEIYYVCDRVSGREAIARAERGGKHSVCFGVEISFHNLITSRNCIPSSYLPPQFASITK